MRYLNERQITLKYVLHSLNVDTEDADEYITMNNGDTLNLHVIVALIQMCGGGLGYDIDWSKLDSPDCDELFNDLQILQDEHAMSFVRQSLLDDLNAAIARFNVMFDWFYRKDGVQKRELMNDVDDWLCLLLTYHTLWADPYYGRSNRFPTRQLIGADRRWMRWDNEDIFKQVEGVLREVQMIP